MKLEGTVQSVALFMREWSALVYSLNMLRDNKPTACTLSSVGASSSGAQQNHDGYISDVKPRLAEERPTRSAHAASDGACAGQIASDIRESVDG